MSHDANVHMDDASGVNPLADDVPVDNTWFRARVLAGLPAASSTGSGIHTLTLFTTISYHDA